MYILEKSLNVFQRFSLNSVNILTIFMSDQHKAWHVSIRCPMRLEKESFKTGWEKVVDKKGTEGIK